MQPDRLPDCPAVPSITEAGPAADLTVQSWHGIFTAGGTPAPVIQALNAAVLAALADAAVRRRIEGLSITVVGSTPDAFATFYAAETRRWAEVVQKAGIKAE